MLLEGTSYINEGAGEAIKNFFIKIKDAISNLIFKVVDFFKRAFGKNTSDYKSTAKEIKDSKMTIADVNNAIASDDKSSATTSSATAAQQSQTVQWYRITYNMQYLSESMQQVATIFDIERYLHNKLNSSDKKKVGKFKKGIAQESSPAELACGVANEYIKKRFEIQKGATSIPELRQLLFDKIAVKVDKPDQLTTADIEELAHADEFKKESENMITAMKKMNTAAETNFNKMAAETNNNFLVKYHKNCAILASHYTQIVAIMLTTITNIIILKLNQTKRLARKALSAHKIASRADTKIIKSVL